jgi:hypothetical protein
MRELWVLRFYLPEGQVEVCGTEELMRQAFEEFHDASYEGSRFRVTGIYDTSDRAELNVSVDREAVKALTLFRRN